MSDVVAVALITSLATLTGSAGVTYLSHRLEGSRSRRAARRARLDSAAQPIVDFVTLGRKQLNLLDTMVEWQTARITGQPRGRLTNDGNVVGKLTDDVERAEVRIRTLVDDADAIALIDDLRRTRRRAIDYLIAGSGESGDLADLQKYSDQAAAGHVLLSRASERMTTLVRSS